MISDDVSRAEKFWCRESKNSGKSGLCFRGYPVPCGIGAVNTSEIELLVLVLARVVFVLCRDVM